MNLRNHTKERKQEPMKGIAKGWKAVMIVKFALAILWSSSLTAPAASFDCPAYIGACPLNVIWLTGTISPGDAQLLQKILVDRRAQVSVVVFADSPGGNLIEAMEIGRLIRSLRVASAVGWVFENKRPPIIYYPEASLEQATGDLIVPHSDADHSLCESACALAWLGGTPRIGYAFLGVHSIALRHIAPSHVYQGDRMTMGKATELMKEYLAEIDAPSSLEKLIEETPAAKTKLLSFDYIMQEVDVRTDDEKIAANRKCGSDFLTFEDIRLGRTDPSEFAKVSVCVQKVLTPMREDALAKFLAKN
jgi:hypothetical protein